MKCLTIAEDWQEKKLSFYFTHHKLFRLCHHHCAHHPRELMSGLLRLKQEFSWRPMQVLLLELGWARHCWTEYLNLWLGWNNGGTMSSIRPFPLLWGRFSSWRGLGIFWQPKLFKISILLPEPGDFGTFLDPLLST